MAESIGIKEANGKFYPILDVNSSGQKRMVLTTAHEKQKSVQIDLYKSNMKTMADAMYIGSIVMENITAKAKGSPSIQMTISSDGEGFVNVIVLDLGNPANEHHLSVSLNSFEDDKIKYPDFEAETPVFSNDDDTEGEAQQETGERKQKRKKPWLVFIIILALLALIGLGLWYYLPQFQFDFLDLLPQSWPTPHKQTGSVIRAQDFSVARQTPPPAIPPEGITWKVRQGDTLWDISEVFYRNPRYYTIIASSNDMSNSTIVAPGTELTIFPKR